MNNLNDVLSSIVMLLVLLNPFLIIVYLIDIIKKKSKAIFFKVMIRAGVMSAIVFCAFALLGDVIFREVFHASFASFQIFGDMERMIINIFMPHYWSSRCLHIWKSKRTHFSSLLMGSH